jgi:hypothetical protein
MLKEFLQKGFLREKMIVVTTERQVNTRNGKWNKRG